MKLLKEIYFGEMPSDTSGWDQRKSARAVVLDADNNVGILYAKTFAFPKLPGGGVDEGEDKEQALVRECKEELGCDVEIVGEIGKVIEYRELRKMVQESFCFLARVVGEKGQPTFTIKELNEGLEIRWLPLEEVLEMFDADPPEGYEPKFIQIRERIFLQQVKQ